MSRKELDSLDLTALGKHSIEQRFIYGANLDVANAATEDLWGSATQYVALTADTAMEVVSSSVNDASAGTGARTVRVKGVKADFTLEEEDVTLNGTTAVIFAETYLAIYEVVVLTAGSGGVNAGKLTCRVSVAGASQNHVEIGENKSSHGIYPVPAGFTLLIHEVFISTDASSGVNVKFYEIDTGNTGLKTLRSNFQANSISRNFKVPIKFNEKTHIIAEATNGSGGTAFVSMAFNGRLVPNSYLRSV